ncbi:MAG: DUF507 family protein [Pseudomonadota bacterium]
MKLYTGKIPIIAAEITRSLINENDIEVSDHEEVEKDVEAILREYIRVERLIDEEAKDRISRMGLTYSDFAKAKRLVAKQKNFGIGDEAITYIIQQLIECFMHSSNVEEVFSDDQALTVRIRNVLRKHMGIDDEIEKEVRSKIKHVEDGTREWEVEYEKVREETKRKLKLT